MYEEGRNLSIDGTSLHLLDVRKPKASELYKPRLATTGSP